MSTSWWSPKEDIIQGVPSFHSESESDGERRLSIFTVCLENICIRWGKYFSKSYLRFPRRLSDHCSLTGQTKEWIPLEIDLYCFVLIFPSKVSLRSLVVSTICTHNKRTQWNLERKYMFKKKLSNNWLQSPPKKDDTKRLRSHWPLPASWNF